LWPGLAGIRKDEDHYVMHCYAVRCPCLAKDNIIHQRIAFAEGLATW